MTYDFNKPVASDHVRQAWIACPWHPFLKLMGRGAADIVEEVDGVCEGEADREPLADIVPDFETDDDAVKLLDPVKELDAVNEAEGVTVKEEEPVFVAVIVTEGEPELESEMETVPVGEA